MFCHMVYIRILLSPDNDLLSSKLTNNRWCIISIVYKVYMARHFKNQDIKFETDLLID